MTAESLARVQTSFDTMTPVMEPMTARFYTHLFTARPETQALFKVDMDLQRRHLAAALALIVRNLAVLDALEQPLRDLGARHAAVGVRPEYYPVVVDAMLTAMAEALGPAWTAELAGDWTALLLTVSRSMLAGAVQFPSTGMPNEQT